MAILSGWPAQARVMPRTWSRLLLLTLALVPPGYVAATALKPTLFNYGKQLLIKTSSQEGEFNYKRASNCREDERYPRKLFTLLLQNYFEVVYYRKKKKTHQRRKSIFRAKKCRTSVQRKNKHWNRKSLQLFPPSSLPPLILVSLSQHVSLTLKTKRHETALSAPASLSLRGRALLHRH